MIVMVMVIEYQMMMVRSSRFGDSDDDDAIEWI